MCRFALYMGPAITLDYLTTRPEHSIIRQSFKSREMDRPLNGDGFGLAWYVPDISERPAQFRSIQPAWNNVNLLHLGRVSRSEVILAHVRAATPGIGVSESNCHPFAAGRFAFMHNGSVAEFSKIKRRLQERLSDESFLWIHGTTDSENMFALFRDHAAARGGARTLPLLADALNATIHDVTEMVREAGATERTLINSVVTDGQRAVVSRYTTDDSDGLTLYTRSGARYQCEDKVCRMLEDDQSTRTAIVASEPLTAEDGWEEVPRNHLVLVDEERRITLAPIAAPTGSGESAAAHTALGGAP